MGGLVDWEGRLSHCSTERCHGFASPLKLTNQEFFSVLRKDLRSLNGDRSTGKFSYVLSEDQFGSREMQELPQLSKFFGKDDRKLWSGET